MTLITAELDAAKRYFDAQIDSALRQQIVDVSFTMDAKATNIVGSVKANIRSFMPNVVMNQWLEVNVRAVSAVAKPQVRQLDVVMCIDATGSMTPTLNAVKTNALNFESNLNSELTKRGIPPFDAMRVRVAFYRDYGGNYLTGGTTGVFVYSGGTYTYKVIKPSDPDYWTYVGDTPPTHEFGILPSACQPNRFQGLRRPGDGMGRRRPAGVRPRMRQLRHVVSLGEDR